MNNTIAKEFTVSSLLRFAFPTMVMMMFTSLYTIVDGIFVSRFVGTNALSAVNIVYPLINVVIGVGVMLATGGSAVIARQMGEGKNEDARRNFSFLVLFGVLAGVVIGVLGLLFTRPIVLMLGASEALVGYCEEYLRILLLFAPAMMLQLLFQTFFVTAGKPMLGLLLTVGAGVTNAVLDYVLIVPLQMGIRGAALATVTGYLLPSVFGVVYFLRRKEGLHFIRPRFNGKVLRESAFNGMSEMVTNLSMGIITFLFNITMMRYLGEDGVAAITIVMYSQFLLTSMFLGFSMGVGPVVSYNYGSANHPQLKKVFKICIWSVGISSVVILVCSLLFSSSLVGVFTPKDSPVYAIASRGFLLFSVNYLFAGVNIFASAFFTALSDGKVSAIISLMRTFVFIVLGMLLLPLFLQVDGIWLAVPFAELLSILLSFFFLRRGARKYQYA